jgi:hypothetical protein
MPWGRGKTAYFKCRQQRRIVKKNGVIKYKKCGRKFASLQALVNHGERDSHGYGRRGR